MKMSNMVVFGDGGPVRDDGDGGLESDDRAEKELEKSGAAIKSSLNFSYKVVKITALT